MKDALRKWRRDLHQIPELGLQEVRTTAYLDQALRDMGYQPEPLGATGLYVYIEHGANKTLAFRSDIDGLSIKEETHLPYASRHEGLMHACGHDGHMSALLGFAKRLKACEKKPDYNVLLLFQMAEEAPGGARLIVESGLLHKLHVEAVFGVHVMPFLPEGVLASKAGPLMAECAEINIHIQGRGAHAGTPENGVDAIMIASMLIQGYQSILTRMKKPFAPAILNIGEIHGGQARNSVAETCVLKGTVRVYDDDLLKDLKGHIAQLHKGVEEAYGCQITWDCDPMYPPVINDAHLFHQVQRLCHLERIEEPLMLAEDFAYYQTVVKGLFVFVGTRTNELTSDLHTSTFNFNEDVLEKVVMMYEKILYNLEGE